jgi:hypothetical protein
MFAVLSSAAAAAARSIQISFLASSCWPPHARHPDWPCCRNLIIVVHCSLPASLTLLADLAPDAVEHAQEVHNGEFESGCDVAGGTKGTAGSLWVGCVPLPTACEPANTNPQYQPRYFNFRRALNGTLTADKHRLSTMTP